MRSLLCARKGACRARPTSSGTIPFFADAANTRSTAAPRVPDQAPRPASTSRRLSAARGTVAVSLMVRTGTLAKSIHRLRQGGFQGESMGRRCGFAPSKIGCPVCTTRKLQRTHEQCGKRDRWGAGYGVKLRRRRVARGQSHYVGRDFMSRAENDVGARGRRRSPTRASRPSTGSLTSCNRAEPSWDPLGAQLQPTRAPVSASVRNPFESEEERKIPVRLPMTVGPGAPRRSSSTATAMAGLSAVAPTRAASDRPGRALVPLVRGA